MDSTITQSHNITISLESFLTALVVLFMAITAYIQVRSYLQRKPKVARLITSTNGSKVVLAVINQASTAIKVESVFIRTYKFLFFTSSPIKVELQKKNDTNIVISPTIEAIDNIIFRPPESVYFLKYKICIKTSGGNCSKIYDPDSVSGISRNLVDQHKLDVKSKRNWLLRKLS